MSIKFYYNDIPDGTKLVSKVGEKTTDVLSAWFSNEGELLGQKSFHEIDTGVLILGTFIALAGTIAATVRITHVIDKSNENKKIIELKNKYKTELEKRKDVEIAVCTPLEVNNSIEAVTENYKKNMDSKEAKMHYIRMMISALIFLKEREALKNANIDFKELKNKVITEEHVQYINQILSNEKSILTDDVKESITNLLNTKEYKAGLLTKQKLEEIVK